MHRFYCPQANLGAKQVILTQPPELHHLRDVLRLKTGDVVYVFNGTGDEAKGVIHASEKNQVTIDLQSLRKSIQKLPVMLLACAVPKKSKFELIIEKATELGVDEIIPLQTKRTEVRLQGERLKKKTARYQAVAVNAAKQCRRPTVPHICPTMDLSSALEMTAFNTTMFIPSLETPRTGIINAFAKNPSTRRIAFFIGPEGDFTPQEYALARRAGAIPVSLGETVLKVETAAITALACAVAHYRCGKPVSENTA